MRRAVDYRVVPLKGEETGRGVDGQQHPAVEGEQRLLMVPTVAMMGHGLVRWGVPDGHPEGLGGGDPWEATGAAHREPGSLAS